MRQDIVDRFDALLRAIGVDLGVDCDSAIAAEHALSLIVGYYRGCTGKSAVDFVRQLPSEQIN